MADNLGPIHCLCAAKAVPKNGAPSSNADKAAFRRLQENVLPQWQQKIALRAENKPVQSLITTSTLIIFCVSNFLSSLRRQFSGLRDGLLKPNVSNPFSQKYHTTCRIKI